MLELIDAIAAGDVAPIYYLCGEPYPVDQTVQAIRQAVLGQEANSFNYDLLQAKEAGADGILAAARTMPMLGPKRLVLVRDVHLLDAKALSRLLPYVQDPSPSSCLLMVAEKADLRLKFFSELKRHGVVQRFDPLKDRQVAKWVTSEAKRMKIGLKPGAAERIFESVGTDMAQLASALERLSLFVGLGQPVTPADVDELLLQTRQHSIFELTNAVGRGQRREALLVLHRMVQDRQPGIMIVTMLARHLRQLWSVKELDQQGCPSKTIATQIGLHPFFVNDMVQQAQRFTESMLKKMHRALFEADRALKSSPLQDAIILERLVMSLCPAAR